MPILFQTSSRRSLRALLIKSELLEGDGDLWEVNLRIGRFLKCKLMEELTKVMPNYTLNLVTFWRLEDVSKAIFGLRNEASWITPG